MIVNFNKAVKIIKSNVKPIQRTQSILVKDAIGRVLTKLYKSPIDLPEFDCSAMDGIVINESDLNKIHKFKIVGESKAGMKKSKRFLSGECLFIFTGAPLPPGKKKIIPIEYCKNIDEKFVKIKKEIPLSNFIRKKGSDITRKKLLIKEKVELTLRDVSMLYSAKIEKLQVLEKPKISVILTGDEISKKKSIVASNNTLIITSFAKIFGGDVIDVLYVEDNKKKLSNAFEKLNRFDLLVTSGGISKGKYDFVKEVLREKEIKFLFEKISIKPGKPTTFGKLPDNRFFLGLPGNPVSCFVTAFFFMGELLNSFKISKNKSSNYLKALSLDNFTNHTNLTLFLRIKEIEKNNKKYFKIFQIQDSHMNYVLKESTGLIIVNPKTKIYKNNKYDIISFKNFLFSYI